MTPTNETYIDKAGWGTGAWNDEPDRREWRDATTGLPCLIVRNGGGALCGYVAVPPGHPWHGKDYDDVDAHVHGGLTFAGRCQEREHGICHVAAPGEPDDVWWLGFDCSHCGDVSPSYNARLRRVFEHDTYQTITYVADEVQRLAAQAGAVAR